MFTKIVVGIDGSDTSRNAVRAACDLTKHYGAELHLVHTPQPDTVAFALGAMAEYNMAMTMPSGEDVKEAAEAVLKTSKDLADSQGVSVAQTHITSGEPADEIVGYADEIGAELIVTGRRGLGSVGALIQGSTSLRISHLAKCACLSVV